MSPESGAGRHHWPGLEGLERDWKWTASIPSFFNLYPIALVSTFWITELCCAQSPGPSRYLPSIFLATPLPTNRNP